ncbi:MAG: hypothetical protein AAFV54_12390 [Pseudomonadota bacterium]
MSESTDVYIDRMSGGDDGKVAPFVERLEKYRTSEAELSLAKSALERGPTPEEGSRLDVEEAATVLETSAQRHAFSLVGTELDKARADGRVSEEEAGQIYQRSMQHRMKEARREIEADAHTRDGQSHSDDQGQDR